MNNSIIRYARFEGKRAIFVPSEDGIKYIDSNKTTVVSQNNPAGLALTKGEEPIGKAKLIAYIVDLGTDIQHMSVELNVPLNKATYRLFTQSGVNFFLNLPYTTRDSKF